MDPEFVTLFVRIIIETAVVNALIYLALLIDRLVAHCEVLDNWRYYLYDCSWWGLPVALPCVLHLFFGALYIIFSAAGAVFRFLG